MRQTAVAGQHQQHRMLGHRNGVARRELRQRDPPRYAGRLIDPVDARSQLLDEAELARLVDELAGHRSRHDEQNVGAGDGSIPPSRAGVAEADNPIGRHGRFDAFPNARGERVDDGDGGR